MADTHDLQMGVQENKEEKWSMDDNDDEEEEEEIEVSVKQSVVVDPKLQDPKEKKLPASTEESLYFFTSSSSKPRPALDWIWGKKDVKVSNDKQQFSVTVEGKKQEPFAEVYFTTAYSRHADSTRLRLVLDELQFGIVNCFNEPRKRGHFIYRLEVEAKPSESWSDKCTRMPSPKPFAMPQIFQEQKSRTSGIQMPVMDPRQASVIYQRGKVVGYNSPEFAWSPAKITGPLSTRSVTWSWEIHRWQDGSKFKVNRAIGLTMSKIPKLPSSLNPEIVACDPESFVAEAFWEVPNNVLEAKVEWRIEVLLHTAYLQQVDRVLKLKYCSKAEKGEFKIDSKVELVLD